MPVMSVPQSAIKDVGSWLGNPDTWLFLASAEEYPDDA